MEVDRSRFCSAPATSQANGTVKPGHPHPATSRDALAGGPHGSHPPGHHRGNVWQRDEWSIAPDRALLPALGGGLFLAAGVIALLVWSHQASGVTPAAGDSIPAFHLLPGEVAAPPQPLVVTPGKPSPGPARQSAGKRPAERGGASGKQLPEGGDASAGVAALAAGLPEGPAVRTVADPFAATAFGRGAAEDGSQGGGAASRGLKVVRRTRVLDLSLVEDTAKKKPRARRMAVPPKARYTPKPDYPESAEKRALEGTALIRVLISEKGAISKHEIETNEPLFEQSILKALALWQFLPALDEDGKPIEAWREYRLVFKMGGSGR